MFGETLINMQDVHVTYQRWGQSFTALAGIDLEVKSGQWVMIVGHNGSGKSTLLKVVSGQQEVSTGKIMSPGELTVYPAPPAGS